MWKLTLFASLSLALLDTSYPALDTPVQAIPNWSASFPLNPLVTSPIITNCLANTSWGLSFDDGPTNSTRNVLNSLAKANLTATFFVVGSRILQNPEILQQVYLAGHEIAVHTWSHPDLTTLTDGQIIAELVWSMKIIKDVIGVVPRIMRAPFGAINAKVQQAAAALGMKLVSWSEDSLDYTFVNNATNTKIQVLNAFRNWTSIREPGVISLEHDLYEASTLYIDDVIGIVKNAGYNIMPVSQCINDGAFYQNFTIPPQNGTIILPVSNSTTSCSAFYTIVSGDTCFSIASSAGISLATFYLINPTLNDQSCTLIQIGQVVCTKQSPSIPISTISVAKSTTVISSTNVPIISPTATANLTLTFSVPTGNIMIPTPTTIISIPSSGVSTTAINVLTSISVPTSTLILPLTTNSMPTSTVNCTKYYTVVSGDTCYVITVSLNTTLSVLYSINPTLNDQTCIILQVGQQVCVAPIPRLSLSSPSMPMSTLGQSTNFSTTSISVPIITSSAILSTSTNSINLMTTVVSFTMNGVSALNSTMNVPLSTINMPITAITTTTSIPTSTVIVPTTAITTTLSVPILTAITTTANLNRVQTTTINVSTTITTMSPNIPTPTQTIICTKFYTVVSGDSCYSIAKRFGLTLTQLFALNPDLKSACSNLQIGRIFCLAKV